MQDDGYDSQFGTIAIVYVLNALLIGGVLIVGLTIIGSLCAPWVRLRLNLGTVIAISNAASFALTYACSLSWTASPDMVRRLRGLAEAKGYNRSFGYRIIAPVALSIWGGFSFIFSVSLFYTLGAGALDSTSFGSLLASFGGNVFLLQAVFVRRSVKIVAMGDSDERD